MRKKIIALGCTLALMASLAGCGTESDGQNGTRERRTDQSMLSSTEEASTTEETTEKDDEAANGSGAAATSTDVEDKDVELDAEIVSAMEELQKSSDDVTLTWPTDVEVSSSGRPSIFLEFHDNYSQSLGDFTMYQCVYSDLCMPKNQEEEFPGIQKAIDSFNKIQERGPKYFSNSDIQERFDKAKSDDSNYRGYSDKYTPSITRIDDQVLSVLVDYESICSVANDYKAKEGYTYNAVTGEEMSILDVVSSLDELKSVAKDILATEYADVLESEPDVEKAFDESFGDEEGLQWTLGPTYLSLYYNPEVASFYKVGTIEINIRYEDYPDLFDKGIGEADGNWVMSFSKHTANNPDDSYLYLNEDLDEDNVPESIKISGNLTIDTGIDQLEVEFYEGLGKCYLVKNSDKYLLYIHCMGDNDYDLTRVFDLTGGSIKNLGSEEGEISAIETIYDSSYDEASYYVDAEGLFYDPESFYLKQPLGLLSSYSGVKRCKVNDDGTIQELDEEFRIYAPYNLTSLVEQNLDELDSEGNVIGNVLIDDGTNFTFYRTDGETYVDFILSDERIVRVPVDASNYPQKVNGKNIDEVFSGMVFAG